MATEERELRLEQAFATLAEMVASEATSRMGMTGRDHRVTRVTDARASGGCLKRAQFNAVSFSHQLSIRVVAGGKHH